MHRILFTLLIILFLGCNKGKENKAVFAVSSPEIESYYFGGDTVFINGQVVGESSLFGLTIQLLNDANDSLMFSYNYSNISDTYDFSTFYVNQVSQHMDVRLEIVALLDENGFQAKKTIPIHLYP